MRHLLSSAALAALIAPATAYAQRTDDNATTQSTDAFGKSVGDERIGIYDPNNVRGFSAVEAGNTRIEGLYFFQQANPTDRLVDGSTMRVGIAAQGYPFPAPTGIADYSLRKPGAKPLVSLVGRVGPFDAKVGQLDLQLPIDGQRLGVAAAVGYFDEPQHFGGTPKYLSMAVTPVWRPSEDIEVLGFWSSIQTSSQEAQTLAFTAGDYRPSRVKRRVFAGQPWATYEGTSWNMGAIAKAKLGGFDLALGGFRSLNHDDQNFIDLIVDLKPDGSGERLVLADKDNKFAANSGEFRVSRSLDEGDRRHTLIATARVREQRRRYGGTAELFLGPTQYGVPDFKPLPAFTIGAKTRDQVSQKTFGLGYQMRWAKVGELGIGLQKTDYSKSVDFPDREDVTSKSSPWLPTANVALNLTDTVAVYASYSKGLEESPVAPERAVNRNEAPPAILTEQKDAGVRWTVQPGLSALVGVFEITKPYYAFNSMTGRFGNLGQLRHRGVEVSVAGQILPGLNMVAGTLFLDADVSGELVDSGAIGSKPVGSIKRRTIGSVDYRFPKSPFSIDAVFEETDDRVANIQNTLVVPPRAVLAVGGRYRFNVGKSSALVRAQVSNIFNNYGYGVGGSGFFVYNLPRRFSLTLSADI
ncbi:TonB-dependent receptor [Sphingomonas sp. ID1715]|uniref:TonB-dependent receptor domain-containing protein n=1 Tax=Sphingomonas sp. ID1715 TaxID=1656898 RepID=UPI001488635A|nr:TonB-dependent receptor [Sphingomonas sp. ID1715]NNM75761.1 TonB-dependent receptor [Sphingomonas sp. ID1715]